MSYIPDFTSYNAEVTIDKEEILDYVRENREWFQEELENDTDSQVLIQIRNILQDTLNKHNKTRISRDINQINNSEVEIYNSLEEALKIIESNI